MLPRQPATDRGPRHHGNWRHGRYTMKGRQSAREFRYFVAAFFGRAAWRPPARRGGVYFNAFLSFPADETGYDFSATHPSVCAWLGRITELPGWRAPYDLLPGKRLDRFV